MTKGKCCIIFDKTPEGDELRRLYMEAIAMLNPSHLKLQDRMSNDGKERIALYHYIATGGKKKKNTIFKKMLDVKHNM